MRYLDTEGDIQPVVFQANAEREFYIRGKHGGGYLSCRGFVKRRDTFRAPGAELRLVQQMPVFPQTAEQRNQLRLLTKIEIFLPGIPIGKVTELM